MTSAPAVKSTYLPPTVILKDKRDRTISVGFNGSLSLFAGGGKCITGRDCFNYNGTCTIKGECVCPQNYTGSYCQMFKTEKSGLATLAAQTKLKFKIKAGLDEAQGKGEKEHNPNLPPPPKDQDTFVKIDTSTDAAPIMRRGREEVDDREDEGGSVPQQEEKEEEELVPIKMKPMDKRVKVKPKPNKKEKKGKNKKSNKKGKKGVEEDGEEEEEALPKKKKKETKKDKERNLQSRMAELYGDGDDMAYPEPMLAGKIPGNIAHDRELMRRASLQQFKFSIR